MKIPTKVEDLRSGDLVYLTPNDRVCRVDGTMKTTHNGHTAWMVKAHYARDVNYEVYFGAGHQVLKVEK